MNRRKLNTALLAGAALALALSACEPKREVPVPKIDAAKAGAAADAGKARSSSPDTR
jgi:hypothetical protein